jgi:hypothetical protein
MQSEVTPEIKTRVIYELDASGHVQRITWEPANFPGARKTCVVATHNVMHKVNSLLWTLGTWAVPFMNNADRHNGYQRALLEINASDELLALKNATADLRPYLAVMARSADGLKISESPNPEERRRHG